MYIYLSSIYIYLSIYIFHRLFIVGIYVFIANEYIKLHSWRTHFVSWEETSSSLLPPVLSWDARCGLCNSQFSEDSRGSVTGIYCLFVLIYYLYLIIKTLLFQIKSEVCYLRGIHNFPKWINNTKPISQLSTLHVYLEERKWPTYP